MACATMRPMPPFERVTIPEGLTHPYKGAQPCAREYVDGWTFRWVKGDCYVAVMRGICVDSRRIFVLRDRFDAPKYRGVPIHEEPRPLEDVIRVNPAAWGPECALLDVARRWLTER